MSASTRTSHLKISSVSSSAGDTVTLHCKLSPEISGGTREIRWFKETECIHQQSYEDRRTFGCMCMRFGRKVSLTLRDVKVMDSGQYRCEAHGERKEEVAVIYLHVAGLKLVSRSHDFGELIPGDDVTLSCHLSPKKSAVAMEIRWFKGTDCICLYQNGQVKEGKGYEGRVRLCTHKLRKGDVSLILRNFHESRDEGLYKCEVTCGDEKVETSVHVSCNPRESGSAMHHDDEMGSLGPNKSLQPFTSIIRIILLTHL
ncbi:butyrophilin subfamily 1 member A1-like isoform X2 [Ictalurus furcatus]|uniref:butyrophilin subfamily 1 member A1-like isoform X2 n=1 Tax=Ictalurus furcatus TaxID=66913 RepID=UPI0023509003|nr:butyrophilin subfamily 1 member A1-like isoform X2 [Ictalurus furcatus]